ncbi:MAG TPA: pilus assembly protein PilZ [Treponema sp.]|nr:pilus assembly protein PilZ [Treponema sp.]
MKLLLILASDESFAGIVQCVRPLGFELIRYRQMIKAMDNIDEINPHAIIVSARDFPRHWKILTQFVRGRRSKEECPIIILKDEHFSLEETSKALFLGVSGLVNEVLSDLKERDRLQNILGRYTAADEKRRSGRVRVEPWQRFGFLFSNPTDGVIVNGDIKTISSGGLSFSPSSALLIHDITLGTELHECSLRAGDNILSPVCKINRAGRIISLEFISFSAGEQSTLDSYLEALPLLELKVKQEF